MSWVNWQRDGWRHLERMDRSNFLEGQQEARAIAQRRTILTQGVRCLAILLGEEQTGKSVGSVSCHLILTELCKVDTIYLYLHVIKWGPETLGYLPRVPQENPGLSPNQHILACRVLKAPVLCSKCPEIDCKVLGSLCYDAVIWGEKSFYHLVNI